MSRNIRIQLDLPLSEYDKLKTMAGSSANVPHYIRKMIQEYAIAWTVKLTPSANESPDTSE